MKLRLPNLLSGLQGKSQLVHDELFRLGEQMVHSSEGTRAIALELCREFEDKFLLHISSGEGGGWKVVASFEGNFPNRIKQLPLDKHFDINNVKRVHRVLIDIVSAAANATPGLGRYPPFKREVITIASNALESFRNEAKKMVVALIDMERAFVPPQHFIRLVQRRSSKRLVFEMLRVDNATSPQPGSQQPSGSLKSIKDKSSSDKDKDSKDSSSLQVAGPEGRDNSRHVFLERLEAKVWESSALMKKMLKQGSPLETFSMKGESRGHVRREVKRIIKVLCVYSVGKINDGFLLKRSAKTNGWSRRWFVLNEKSGKLGYTKKQEERHFRGVITLEECNIDEASEEEEALKIRKTQRRQMGNSNELVFLLIPYRPLIYCIKLAAHSAVVLKAESMSDKTEWVNKIKSVAYKGAHPKGAANSDVGPMRQSHSDGSLDAMARRPADPEEELRWMSQEVRGYVEAVLNSLAANVPKEIVLCQVEKAKEDMLNQLYSSVSAQSTTRIEELLQEDQNVKRRRKGFKDSHQSSQSLLVPLVCMTIEQLLLRGPMAMPASRVVQEAAREGATIGGLHLMPRQAPTAPPWSHRGPTAPTGMAGVTVTRPRMVMPARVPTPVAVEPQIDCRRLLLRLDHRRTDID
ncbi:hypothetical protein HPP92_027189 [Vanilla planifolia]|uniref:Dynamin GTPase n=1 Tax=Vanilla planifolia TaxID=51239 RepID=A0A835P9S0_VANPL|nr:hypothetical protein HPP92_027189 [Vanilla planifolia]